jgi:hypothetical protein
MTCRSGRRFDLPQLESDYLKRSMPHYLPGRRTIVVRRRLVAIARLQPKRSRVSTPRTRVASDARNRSLRACIAIRS